MTIATENAGSRRDRRFQKKRAEIVSVAMHLFSEKGFANTTTKEIAEAADIGESTLYNYFTNKREILSAMINHNQAKINELFRTAITLNSRAAFVDLIAQRMQSIIAHRVFLRSIILEAWMDNDILDNYVKVQIDQFVKVLEQFLEAQVAAGTLRPIDTNITARFMIGMFFSLEGPVIRGYGPVPTPEQCHLQAEAMVSLLLDGLRPRTEK
jgi:AcrR family transcriptional regulator